MNPPLSPAQLAAAERARADTIRRARARKRARATAVRAAVMASTMSALTLRGPR